MPKRWKRVNTSDATGESASGEQKVVQKKAEAPPLSKLASFVPEEPARGLDQLVVSEDTVRAITSVLSKIRNHHVLYEEWGLAAVDPMGRRTAINLYGPPGTGKSLCAEGIARELSMSLIRVSYAELESKYVGETPKNIEAAFAKAKATNSVLFFDEADSILGKRLTSVTQSADHGVNVSRSVMLIQMDRFEGVVVFATNLASNYDGAFVRRIIGHVNIPLPDLECRERIWMLHLPEAMPRDDDVTAAVLAEHSKGLSGGDILNATVSAATRAVDREGEARRVQLRDLREAIGAIRRAQEEVGSVSGPAPQPWRETHETVPLDEAPEDVQAAARDESLETFTTDEIFVGPDGFAFDAATWRGIFQLWWGLAASDGDVSKVESSRIRAFARVAGVNHLESVASAGETPPDPAAIGVLVDQPVALRYAFRDGLLLAWADGDYCDAERQYLLRHADQLGLPTKELQAHEDWARGWLEHQRRGDILVSDGSTPSSEADEQ